MKARVFVVSILVLFFTITVTAQTTEFTYQGSLKDGANPAAGNYDFEFSLFDAYACDASEPGSVIEETVAAGGSSLSYDAAADQYKYV